MPIDHTQDEAGVGEAPRRPGVLTRVVASVDRWQRRHALGGFPLAVLKKFGEDRASSLAALVAYYAFFSLFPLLLAFVSILGFVLEDNPELRDDVLDTALARIPVIGAELRGEVQPLTGSGIALAVGLAGALWAGLGVTLALGRAFAEIWDMPRLEQPGGAEGASARARGPGDPRERRSSPPRPPPGSPSAVGSARPPQRGAAVAGALAVNVVVFLTVFALLDPPAAARSASCCPASGWRRSARLPSSRWEAGTSTTWSSTRARSTARSRSSSACSRGSGWSRTCCSSPPRSTSSCAGACGRAR